MLKRVDQWGGPETYPHRTTAAAVRAFAVGVTGGQNTYPRRTVGERRNVGAYLTFALYHWPFT